MCVRWSLVVLDVACVAIFTATAAAIALIIDAIEQWERAGERAKQVAAAQVAAFPCPASKRRTRR